MSAAKSLLLIPAILACGLFGALRADAFQMRLSGTGTLSLNIRPDVKLVAEEPGMATARRMDNLARESTYRVDYRMGVVTRLRLAKLTTAVLTLEIDEAAWAAIPGLLGGEISAGGVSLPLSAGSHAILAFQASGVHPSEVVVRLYGNQQFVSASLPFQLRVTSSDGALGWTSRHSMLWRLTGE